MPSIIAVVAMAALLYATTIVYALLKNYVNALRSGLPYIVIPWDQNSIPWMIGSVPLRPWLARHLPTWIYNRLSLTIYGFEFTEKLRPFRQYAAKQGNDKSYIIVTPGQWELTTRDPEIATEVLKRPHDFQQVDLNAIFMAKFGHNLLTTDGETWSRQRKLVAGTINERISKTVWRESLEHTEGLVDEVVGDKTSGDTNRLFDFMKRVTILVLANAGMGTTTHWRDEEVARPGFKTTFIVSIQRVLNGITGPLVLPKWFLKNYPAFFPGQQMLLELSDAIDEFPKHTWHLMDEERERINSSTDGAVRNNVMSQLIKALDQAETSKKAGAGTLSREEVLGNLFVFSGAGFDTTSNTLSFALVLLARYPSYQKWMLEQIDAILPARAATADLDYSTIFPRATRILAIMLETLRLYTPLIHITKQTRVKQTVTSPTTGKTFVFPANAIIYINTIGLHLDPTIWRDANSDPIVDETTDANIEDETIFRPTRWITKKATSPDGEETLLSPPKGYYLPWSAGPRVCPGQKMAQVEFTAIFLRLFRRHRIEAVPLEVDGETETAAQVKKRLEKQLSDSFPILTLQMDGVYDVGDDATKGLKMRLVRRH